MTNYLGRLAAIAVFVAGAAGCTANVDATSTTTCSKSCDDAQTTCMAKCSDDTCRASCTTTHNNCVTQCSSSTTVTATADGG